MPKLFTGNLPCECDVDVHTPAQRSRNMRAIRAKDTKPEQIVRKLLFKSGFRYRLHDSKLPGRPDILLRKHRAAILVHGCFFHGHECEKFRWPASRAEFWREKISRNRDRDVRAVQQLEALGWRVMVVWECCLRGTGALPAAMLAERLNTWLRSDSPSGEVCGLG